MLFLLWLPVRFEKNAGLRSWLNGTVPRCPEKASLNRRASHSLSRRTWEVKAAAGESWRGARSRSSRADGGSPFATTGAKTEDFDRTRSEEWGRLLLNIWISFRAHCADRRRSIYGSEVACRGRARARIAGGWYAREDVSHARGATRWTTREQFHLQTHQSRSLSIQTVSIGRKLTRSHSQNTDKFLFWTYQIERGPKTRLCRKRNTSNCNWRQWHTFLCRLMPSHLAAREKYEYTDQCVGWAKGPNGRELSKAPIKILNESLKENWIKCPTNCSWKEKKKRY